MHREGSASVLVLRPEHDSGERPGRKDHTYGKRHDLERSTPRGIDRLVGARSDVRRERYRRDLASLLAGSAVRAGESWFGAGANGSRRDAKSLRPGLRISPYDADRQRTANRATRAFG